MAQETHAQTLLRQLRATRSQQEIATAIGVSQSTISRLESGDIDEPKWSLMERLRALATLADAANPK